MSLASCVPYREEPQNGSRHTDVDLCNFSIDVLGLSVSNVIGIMNDVLLVQAILDADNVEERVESADVEVTHSYNDGSYIIDRDIAVIPSEESIYETGSVWTVLLHPNYRFTPTVYKITRIGTDEDIWEVVLETQPELKENGIDLTFLNARTVMTMRRRDLFLNDWRLETSASYDEKNGFSADVRTVTAPEFTVRAGKYSGHNVSECYYMKGEIMLVTNRNGDQLGWCRTVWNGEGYYATKMYTNLSSDYHFWRNF